MGAFIDTSNWETFILPPSSRLDGSLSAASLFSPFVLSFSVPAVASLTPRFTYPRHFCGVFHNNCHQLLIKNDLLTDMRRDD